MKRRTDEKRYYSLKYLFATELPEYLYPSSIPEGFDSISVTAYGGTDEKLFSLALASSGGGEEWHIIAKSAAESYIPMGYEYKTELQGREVKFVYSVARSNGQITRYSVYAVYDDVFYTFYLYTSDFDEVKNFLNSMKKS